MASSGPDPTPVVRRAETIGWLELFFDLVAVAAVAVITHGVLDDPHLPAVGIAVVTYAAVWLSWVLVAFYTNLAVDRTRIRTVVVAMLLIAVMASTAPGHHENRANVFAIAYLVLRGVVSTSSLRSGRVSPAVSVLFTGGVSLPWLASLWIDAPAKYWLWAGGLALELGSLLIREPNLKELSEQIDNRLNRRGRQDREPAGRGRKAQDQGRRGTGHPPGARVSDPVEIVDVDRAHLDERLGTFVIIVLGESVTQLVVAAATTEWTAQFRLVALLSFGVLGGLWWLTFSFGAVGAPHARYADLPPRFGLPLHLASTLGLVGVATGLGGILESLDQAHVIPVLLWCLCGGLGLHFLATGVGGATGSSSATWLLGWALASVVWTVGVGLVGARLSPVAVVALVAVPIAWQIGYGSWRRQLPAGEPTDQPTTLTGS